MPDPIAALALWEYALWGAFGGVAVELIEILGAVKRVKGLPWRKKGEVGLGAMLFCVAARLGLGSGVAVALADAGQIGGSIGALAAGAAAPLILEQLSKQLASQVGSAADAPSSTDSLKTQITVRGPRASRQIELDPRQAAMLRELLAQVDEWSTTGDSGPAQPARGYVSLTDDADETRGGGPEPGTAPNVRRDHWPTGAQPDRDSGEGLRGSTDLGAPRNDGAQTGWAGWSDGGPYGEPDPHGEPDHYGDLDRSSDAATKSDPACFPVIVPDPADSTEQREPWRPPSLARQLLYGFARSTPAFGGTAKLDG